MLKKLISTEELNAYRRLQLEHDDKFHHKIFVLDIYRRMNHIALPLAKYIYPLASLLALVAENKRAFIDSFIMVVSASNFIGIRLSIDLVIGNKGSINARIIDRCIKLLSGLAKPCEATDHQEDYPIWATWNQTIQEFFTLLVHKARLGNIFLLEETAHRLASVKKNICSAIFYR